MVENIVPEKSQTNITPAHASLNPTRVNSATLYVS